MIILCLAAAAIFAGWYFIIYFDEDVDRSDDN